MKKIILLCLGLLLLPIVQSCEENDDVKMPDPYEITWKDDAYLKFTPSNENGSNQFEYYVELEAGGEEYWYLTSIDYEVSLEIGEFPVSDISKVEIYAFAEENNDGTFNYLGGSEGKLLETIVDPESTFMITVTKDQLADLFSSEFSPNHNGDVLVSDIFEFKWVITGQDGAVVDTRKDCFDFNCTYSMGSRIVEIAPPIWEGTYDYEWIEVSAGGVTWGGVEVGQTGTISMELQPGSFTVYDVSDLSCDYYYGGPGALSYSYDTGLVEIIDDTWRQQQWNIIDVDGPTITVEWTYYYTVSYDEYGTFTLTRTDGQDWPSNIYTN